MSCNKCCVIERKTTSVAVVSGTLRLTITNVPTPLANGEKFRICVAQCVPPLANPVPVVLVVNGVVMALIDECGNGVFSDQIRSRKVYCMHFATTLSGFVVDSCQLCCTQHRFPTTQIPVSPPTGGSELPPGGTDEGGDD